MEHWLAYAQRQHQWKERKDKVLAQARVKRLKQVMGEWRIATTDAKRAKVGTMIANEQRVYRLKWLVFGAWVR